MAWGEGADYLSVLTNAGKEPDRYNAIPIPETVETGSPTELGTPAEHLRMRTTGCNPFAQAQ